MDYNPLAELICSDLEVKQAAGLIAAYPYLSIYAPSDAFLSALIENCIVSEKDRIRELAFRCVLELYRSHGVIRWSDIRTSLVTELGTAESSRTLSAALAILAHVPLREQVLLFTSKEGVSAIDGCMSSEHPTVKAAAIREITPYLISSWLYLDVSGNIEGLMKMETPGDIKRFKEDFKDVIVDKLKQFTVSLLGKGDTPPESNPLCREALLVAFGDIFYRCNSSNSHIDDWVEALLGCGRTGVTLEQLRESRRVVAASLSPFLQLIVPYIAVDPHLLVHLCKDTLMRMKCLGVASIRVSRCVTGFVQMLLGSLPVSSTDAAAVQSCGLISGLPDTMEFSSSIGSSQRPADALLEDTVSSRTGTIDYINIIQFAKEWILNDIAPLLLSMYPDEAIYAIRACLELTSHPSLSSLRFQLAPAICHNCIRLIRIATQIPTIIGVKSNVGSSNALIRSWINPTSASIFPANPWCNTSAEQPEAECRRVVALLIPMLSAGAIPLYVDDADVSNLESTVPTSPIALSQTCASFFHPPQTPTCDQHPVGRITPVAELLSYTLLAARYIGRGRSVVPATSELRGIMVAIIEHLTSSALFSCGAGSLDRCHADVWLTRLSTEVAVLLLSDPMNYGSISAPDLLYEVLHNDVVMAILVDPFKETRGFLVAAMCRTYCRIVPGLVTSLMEKYSAVDVQASTNAPATSNSASDLLDASLMGTTPAATTATRGLIEPGRHLRGLGATALLFGQEFGHLQYMSEENTNRSNFAEFLKADCALASKEFEGFVHAGLVMLAEFSSCLSWPANLKATGEAPQLSFICLLSELCRFILPIAPSSVSPSYPIPVPVRESINLWALKQLSDVVESLLWMLKEGSFPSLSAQRNLLVLFAHIIGYLFGITGQSTVDKATELIALLKRDLMNTLPRDARHRATLKASDEGGLGFGASPFSGTKPSVDDIAISAVQPASDPASQLFAITALETVALYHRVVAQQCVAVLQEFLSYVGISHLSPLICTSSGKLLPGRVDKCVVADASVIERAVLALQRTIASSPSKASPTVPESPPKAAAPVRSKYDRLKSLGMNDVFKSKSSIGSDKTDVAIKALLQGSKVTTLSAGVEATDATRCVFKWPIFPGSAPITTSIGEEFGIFSKPPLLGYANKSTAFEPSRPAVADTNALIDDVVNGHLYPRGKASQSSAGSDLSADALLAKLVHTRSSAVQRAHIKSGVLTPTTDVFSSCASRATSLPYLQLSPWTVVSGSSDVMTVSACTLIDPVSRECELKVRVYNSSGFKIPYFALSVGIGAPSTSSAPRASTMRIDISPAAALRHNASPVVDGEEYLAPGAIVERSWRVTLLHFDAIVLQIFVVYTELTAPDTCLDLFTPSGSTSSPAAGAPSALGKLASLGQSMPELTSPNPTSATSGKRLDTSALIPYGLNATRAVVPCKEVVIPPMALLSPYGFGSLTCMRSLTTETSGDQNSQHALQAPLGIPLSVYQSLQHRLASGHSASVHVACHLPAGTSLTDAIGASYEHIWNSGTDLAAAVAVASRVELPSTASSAIWSNRLSQDLVWAFHTMWGDEVCVRLCVSSSPATSKEYSAASSSPLNSGLDVINVTLKNEWSGTLQLFSSSQRCIDALTSNTSAFLQCLTGGIHWGVKSHAVVASSMLVLPEVSVDSGKIARRVDGGKTTAGSTVPAAAPISKPFDAFGFDVFASPPALSTNTTTPANMVASSNTDIFGMFPSTLAPPPPPVFHMGVDPFAPSFTPAPISSMGVGTTPGYISMPGPAPLLGLSAPPATRKVRDRMSHPPALAPNVEVFGTGPASNASSSSASQLVDLLSIDLPTPPAPSNTSMHMHASHATNVGLSLIGESNMAAVRRTIWLSEDRIK